MNWSTGAMSCDCEQSSDNDRRKEIEKLNGKSDKKIGRGKAAAKSNGFAKVLHLFEVFCRVIV